MRRNPRYDVDEDELDDGTEYKGPERRRIIEHPKEFSISTGLQLAGMLGAILISSVSTYMSVHDEQIKLNMKMDNFAEKYKEDQERHNQTHNKIFSEVDKISTQVQSLEDSFTQFIGMKRK